MRPASLELTWVEVEPPAPVPAPQAPVAVVKPSAPVRSQPVSAPVSVEKPAVADRPVADDSPRADSVPRVGLTLAPGSAFAMSLDAGVLLSDDVPRGLHAPAIPKDLVGEAARETLGRGRVERGLVHPYYSQLGKALTKTWNIDRVLKQGGGLKAYGQQLGENFKIGNEIWLNKAAQYGRSGNPLGDVKLPEQRTGPMNDRVGGLNGTDLAARKEMGRQMQETFRSTKRASIRVVQDADGKLIKVELLSPSNDAQVDKEALADVRAAAQSLPAPPAEAVGKSGQLSSIWSFELIVSISPPVPTFTFEFDEVSGFIDPRLPLDRRVYKKIRLESVE